MSCDSSERKTTENKKSSDISANVFLSAGEQYPLFDNLNIPTFFNLGKVNSNKDLNTIILDKKLKKGSKVNIKPIALFTFEQDTVLHSYMVSVSVSNEKIKTSYNDFLMDNIKIQSAIEDWFDAQCGRDRCRNFKWENSYKAYLKTRIN